MQSLVLTPLELALIGGLISLVSGLAVKYFFAGNYISRSECGERSKALASQKRAQAQIFSILRALVIHMPGLTPEQREEIINMPAPKED